MQLIQLFLLNACNEFKCEINEEPHLNIISGKKIIVLHHPELIDENMTSNNDLILHGHTHRFREEKINDALIFNPGECAGFMKGKNKIGIVNLKTKEAKTISF